MSPSGGGTPDTHQLVTVGHPGRAVGVLDCGLGRVEPGTCLLSARSRSPKVTCWMIYLQEASRRGKSLETASRSVVAGGLGRERELGVAAEWVRGFFGDDDNALKLGGGVVAPFCEYAESHSVVQHS